MKKSAFLLSLLLIAIISITMSFSSFALPPTGGGAGLTITPDATGYTSVVFDAAGGSAIMYRTTVASFDVVAYSDPDHTNQIATTENSTDSAYAVRNGPIVWSADGLSYSGDLPQGVRNFLTDNRGKYCKVVLHPRVEAYFGTDSSYAIPGTPILTSPSSMMYANPGGPNLYYWEYISAGSEQACLDKYSLFTNSTTAYNGFHFGDGSGYGPGSMAHDYTSNGVIEYYDAENSVFGSYIGWAGGGASDPFVTFNAINSRFQDTVYFVDPLGGIEFDHWINKTLTNSATNKVTFEYKITGADVDNLLRTTDFAASLYKQGILVRDLAAAETSVERYFQPSDDIAAATGNGRSVTSVEPLVVGPHTAAFNLAVDTLLPGTYMVRVSINATSAIEPYNAAKHQAEFTFTKNSNGTITDGAGINLAITGIHVTPSTLTSDPASATSYTATVDYSVSGSFPDGARLRAYCILLPATTSTNLTPPNEYANTGTALSPTAVALNTGNNSFTFPFTITANYTYNSLRLRAEILPVSATPAESIPYSAAGTDNILDQTFTVGHALAVTPTAKYLGVYPATEQLMDFKNQLLVNSYWLPTGHGTFSDVSWSHTSPNVIAPAVVVKVTTTSGVNSLSGTSSLYSSANGGTYSLVCTDSVGGVSGTAIFGATVDGEQIDLSCQTDSQNVNSFGVHPSHNHGASGNHSNGPNEGGCTNE